MIDAGTHGAVNWVDLSTPDVATARIFYAELLGWTVESSETPMGEYFIGSVGDREVAGMMGQGPELAGTPAVWTTYFNVDDIEHTTEVVADAGGAVLTPPFDIPDARIAIIADPTGGTLGLISGPKPEGTYLTTDIGAVCWVELLTRDPAAAEGFFAQVFGWKAETEVTAGTAYTTFMLEDENVAGMMMMPSQVPAEAPAHWATYFTVGDCTESTARADELGGRVLVPATAIEIGKFAVLADPQGATFHLMEYSSW